MPAVFFQGLFYRFCFLQRLFKPGRQLYCVGTSCVYDFQLLHPFAVGRHHQSVHQLVVAFQFHVFRIHGVNLFHLFLSSGRARFPAQTGRDDLEPAECPFADRLFFQMDGVYRELVTCIEPDGFVQFLIAQVMFFLEYQDSDYDIDRRVWPGENLLSL